MIDSVDSDGCQVSRVSRKSHRIRNREETSDDRTMCETKVIKGYNISSFLAQGCLLSVWWKPYGLATPEVKRKRFKSEIAVNGVCTQFPVTFGVAGKLEIL